MRAFFTNIHLFVSLGPVHCVRIYSVRRIEREFYCCAHGSRCHWHLLNTFSPSVCLLPCCAAPYRSISGSVRVDQMERCSKPSLLRTTALCYLIQRAVSSVSFCLRALVLPLRLLTKTDKGLSFLLARLSSACLYCTEPGSPSHCAPSLSLQRRCLGGRGAPAWRLRPGRGGKWSVW